ncbi:hypothetical protein DY218_15960 [Streptomyces triticagri]|uniref:Uncharacterized protein n=1 Tax=Streptomyces triticagri TaxID=2293568 RepID=A0A372M508_9ACTN|nr:hypothetical protein DY218_15960 [Streptomyces triticagri]
MPGQLRMILLVAGLLVPVVRLGFASATSERIGGGLHGRVSFLVVIAALSSPAAGVVSYTAAESLILENRGHGRRHPRRASLTAPGPRHPRCAARPR